MGSFEHPHRFQTRGGGREGRLGRPRCIRDAYRSSPSRPAEASTVGLTATRTPVRTHARWLGAKRGANNPSLISRVTAKRLNTVGGRYSRSLLGKPSVGVSISPTGAVMMP